MELVIRGETDDVIFEAVDRGIGENGLVDEVEGEGYGEERQDSPVDFADKCFCEGGRGGWWMVGGCVGGSGVYSEGRLGWGWSEERSDFVAVSFVSVL